MAIITEMMIKTATRIRMISSCFFSCRSLITVPLIKSRVSVELDASTRDDRVDMDADNTSTTTTAMRKGERSESMVGMMES